MIREAVNRYLLAALVCAFMALLPAAALAGTSDSQPLTSSAVAAESGANQLQPGGEPAVRPEVQGVVVRHHSRKPRRNNRRQRVRHGLGGDWALSHGFQAATAASEELKQKRRRVKRALMRRLMTVRGGLQA